MRQVGKFDPHMVAEQFTQSGKSVYQVLGVLKSASAPALRSAFRKKSLDLHPDKNPGQEAEYLQLVQAYEVALAIAEERYRAGGGRADLALMHAQRDSGAALAEEQEEHDEAGLQPYDPQLDHDPSSGAGSDAFALPGKRQMTLVIYIYKPHSWKWNLRWTSVSQNVIGGGEDEHGIFVIRGHYDLAGEGAIAWEKDYFEEHRTIRYEGKKVDEVISATWVDSLTGETGTWEVTQAQ